jgi:hypothetical protein
VAAKLEGEERGPREDRGKGEGMKEIMRLE